MRRVCLGILLMSSCGCLHMSRANVLNYVSFDANNYSRVALILEQYDHHPAPGRHVDYFLWRHQAAREPWHITDMLPQLPKLETAIEEPTLVPVEPELPILILPDQSEAKPYVPPTELAPPSTQEPSPSENVPAPPIPAPETVPDPELRPIPPQQSYPEAGGWRSTIFGAIDPQEQGVERTAYSIEDRLPSPQTIFAR